MRFSSPNSGFTLVELIIIVPIAMAVITVFTATLVSMSNDVVQTQTENKMTYETQAALSMIERDTRLSANFLAGNEFAVASPLGYTNSSGAVNSFTNNGPNGEMLILRSLTTDRNPLDSARQIVYRDVAGCSDSQRVVTNYFYSNIIYFLRTDSGNTTLWRRTLLPSFTTCQTPWQRNSCNPSVTKTSACRVDDVKLLDNVTQFTVDYYYNPSDASPVASAKDTSVAIGGASGRNEILRAIPAITVTIETTRTVGGKPVTHSGKIVTSRLNLPFENIN